jgi:hypothetical protein
MHALLVRPAGPLVRRWVVDPVVRGLTGLPLAIAAVPMALSGGAGTIGRLQARLAGLPGAGPPSRPGAVRVLAHGALVLVPAAVAFAAVLLQLFVAYSGYLYPLRPDTIAAIGHPFTPDTRVLPGAWGGPTLAGAWFVHACVAFGIQVVCAVVVRGLCGVQDRVTRRLLAG